MSLGVTGPPRSGVENPECRGTPPHSDPPRGGAFPSHTPPRTGVDFWCFPPQKFWTGVEWIFGFFLLLPAGPGWRKIMLHPRVGWTGVERPKNPSQILSVWGGVGWNGFWEISKCSPPVRGGLWHGFEWFLSGFGLKNLKFRRRRRAKKSGFPN